MYLVYEKNYLGHGEVDCIDESEMMLFVSRDKALLEMDHRKNAYIASADNSFTFMPGESTEECIVFADELSEHGDTREGEFHICLAKLRLQA